MVGTPNIDATPSGRAESHSILGATSAKRVINVKVKLKQPMKSIRTKVNCGKRKR